MSGVEQIVLVEDEGWRRLRPLTWLRPAAGLFVGARSNAERWADATGISPAVLCRLEIAALEPAARIVAAPAGGAMRLWVRDRWIPDESWALEAIGDSTPACWVKGDTVVAVRTDARAAAPAAPAVPAAAPAAPAACDSAHLDWDELARGKERRALSSGAWIDELSDLIREAALRIEPDLAALAARIPPARSFGDGFPYGHERIRVEPGCRIDHGAVLDAREGTIVLGAGTVVFPHTWIRGPFGCRESCFLLGGRIGGGSYLGPHCRVRGEVESSTFQGFDNKAHDGFIGHSYLGEWVNLGALTTTSDLKNNYGPVHLEAYGRRIETGERKIGSFFGDHAKTRIGAMLNSGSVIGLAGNIFGDPGIFPKWAPDFCWGAGPEAREYELFRCLQTVDVVLGRRGKACTPELRSAVEIAFRESQADRDSAFDRTGRGRGPRREAERPR